MPHRITHLLFFLFFLSSGAVFAQTSSIQGSVKTAENAIKGATATLRGTSYSATTDEEGNFLLENLQPGNYVLIVNAEGFALSERNIALEANKVFIASFVLRADKLGDPMDFPIITLEDADADGSDATDVSGILRAGRDIFQNISAFNLFAFRFAERGYGSEYNQVLLNGIRANDPEVGWVSFSEFGGLNDVLRARSSTVGLEAAEYAFGDIGGAAMLDTRASVQRKQVRASYANSNRSYRHRVMATYSTGLKSNGWAFSFSGSRRWAEEGYIDGTFYDAWSYFASIDKKFNEKHSLNLTFLGAPQRRGRAGDAFQENYDIAGSNFYNPRWGYWNDKKRNSSVFHTHQPMGMLRYDWTPTRKTSLMAVAFHQQGPRGTSRLDWYNGTNPNPDYNRLLPSAQPTPEDEAGWRAYLQADEKNRQVDWAGMYAANQTSFSTIENANGIQGNTVTGKWSQYILEDQRQDSRESGINLIFKQVIGPRLTLQAGSDVSIYKDDNYRVVEDLLGGDFYMDYDKFGQIDPENPTFDGSQRYFDLDSPNRVLREGDVFGYRFEENIQAYSGWVQAQLTTKRLDFHISGQVRNTSMWRNGLMRNHNFPNSSKGKSEVLNFLTPSVKGGAVFKLNNRYFVYANGFIGQRAPLFQDAFLTPRTGNRPVPGIKAADIQSIEGGIQVRAPRLKGRITGYLTKFDNEYDVQLYFAPTANVFGSLSIQGISRRHAGMEVAAEFMVIPALTLTAGANIGQYLFTSRPTLTFVRDNSSQPVVDGSVAYQNGYFVPRYPQTAGAISAKYEFKNFMFATVSLNYADNLYYEFDRLRRTASFIETVPKDSELWNTLLEQKKAPAAYTVDAFAGKSWKLPNTRQFINLNVGVNNILNNQNIVTWGREAYISSFRDSNDPRRYSNELSYSLGLNYFISLTYRY